MPPSVPDLQPAPGGRGARAMSQKSVCSCSPNELAVDPQTRSRASAGFPVRDEPYAPRIVQLRGRDRCPGQHAQPVLKPLPIVRSKVTGYPCRGPSRGLAL